MEKHTGSIAVLAAVLFLLIGFLFGGFYGSETITETKTVEVEKIVEVEIPGETIETEVFPDYLGSAVDFFLEEVEDEDRLLVCDSHEYDFDDIEIGRLYDKHTITFDDEDLYVDFKVKLVYDEDDSRSCRNTYEAEVFYEDYFTSDPEEPELELD